MNIQRIFWCTFASASCLMGASNHAMPVLKYFLKPVITVTKKEYEDKIQYTVYLKQRISGRVYGTAVFTYYTKTQTGMLNNLRINRAEQNKGHGSRLLKFALATFIKKHPECDVVKLIAKPLDVNYAKGETTADVFPKLVAFYKRNNAHITFIDNELSIAEMEFRRTESYA